MPSAGRGHGPPAPYTLGYARAGGAADEGGKGVEMDRERARALVVVIAVAAVEVAEEDSTAAAADTVSASAVQSARTLVAPDILLASPCTTGPQSPLQRSPAGGPAEKTGCSVVDAAEIDDAAAVGDPDTDRSERTDGTRSPRRCAGADTASLATRAPGE